MSRVVFALVACVAVLCVCAVEARHRPAHSAPVDTPAQRAHSHHAPAHTKQEDASYSSIMAYHEEPQRPPKPLYEAQWDVEDFHTSGAYDQEMTGVISNAILYAQSVPAAPNSVWVFDVDETSLSGYTEMLSVGFGYVPKLNHEWIMNSSAPAIPQTLNLYNTLIQNNYTVIFLTGRKDTEHDATALNLKNVGYTIFDTLVTRTPEQYNLTATVYKSNVRTNLSVNQGYNIVGCVGDQWSDLHGPYTGYKVKLPNYIYFLP